MKKTTSFLLATFLLLTISLNASAQSNEYNVYILSIKNLTDVGEAKGLIDVLRPVTNTLRIDFSEGDHLLRIKTVEYLTKDQIEEAIQPLGYLVDKFTYDQRIKTNYTITCSFKDIDNFTKSNETLEVLKKFFSTEACFFDDQTNVFTIDVKDYYANGKLITKFHSKNLIVQGPIHIVQN